MLISLNNKLLRILRKQSVSDW